MLSAIKGRRMLKYMDSFLACINESSRYLISLINSIDQQTSNHFANNWPLLKFDIKTHRFPCEITTENIEIF